MDVYAIIISMTEAMKSSGAAETNDWDDLADKSQADWGSLVESNTSARTTWEDLRENARDFEDTESTKSNENTELDESISPIKLTPEQLQKLNPKESFMYYSSPITFSQLQKLREKYDNSENFRDFASDLGLFVDIAHTDKDYDPEKPLKSTHELDQIAHIYDTLGYWASGADLFSRDADELNQVSYYFDIANARLPLEKEEPLPRENLIKSILHKLHIGKTKENPLAKANEELRERNNTRKAFLAALARQEDFRQIDDDSLRQMADATEGFAKNGDAHAAEIIREELGENPGDEIIRYATMSSKFNADQHLSERISLNYFYRALGLSEEKAAKFQNEVLPLVSDPKTGTLRANILRDIPRSKDQGLTEAKWDFALDELLPSITEENQPTWNARARAYPSILARDADRQTYDTVFRDTEKYVLPILMSKTNSIRTSIAGKIIDKRFDELGRGEQDTEKINWYANQSEELIPYAENDESGDIWLRQDLVLLALDRDFEPDFTEYLKTNLFPRITKSDPTLGSWARGAGFLRGENKIRDFDFECLTSKVTPQNINKLLLMQRELPTSDANILEQNRIDALAIENVVIPNHAFIHHEHPLTHDLLSAMVEYYDSGGDKQAKAELDKLAEQCPPGLYGELDKFIYDQKKYEKKIRGEVSDDDRFSREYNATAIEVLRRLVKNTAPNELEVPDVADQKWHELMKEAKIRINPENNRREVDWSDMRRLTAHANSWLLECQDEYGLDPTIINAIAYTERVATFALRNISESERLELPYDEGFKEIVKFQELTASYDTFSPKGFERFFDGFRKIKFGDEEELKEHYWDLAMRELTQAAKLEHKYKLEGKDDAGMILQSGNLLTEITGLSEPREVGTLRERADAKSNSRQV